MKLLGFETTDSVASVALNLDGEVFCTRLETKKRHAESVLPAAEALLAAHGLSTSDMDAFAVDVGPGSFTGVRIGVCLANALGLAHQKPVIAVNALETLAFPLRDNGLPVCAMIDARNGNGYGALYQGTLALRNPVACEIASFCRDLPDQYIGTGTAFSDQALPCADAVVQIAAERAGEKQVSPLYLKLSQAERMQQK